MQWGIIPISVNILVSVHPCVKLSLFWSIGAVWKCEKWIHILITKYSRPLCIELRFTSICQMPMSNMTESKGLKMTCWQASRPFVNKPTTASLYKLTLTCTSMIWVYIIWLWIMLALSNSEHRIQDNRRWLMLWFHEETESNCSQP